MRERLGCTVVPASGGQTERQVSLLTDFGARAICVTPSYRLALLDEFGAQGVDPRSTSLEVGGFGAEPWTDAMRAEIEDAFDIHAVDIHGLSEVIGPGVVRYRTGDLTSLSPGTTRTMRRMGRVTGRVDDMLIVRGVNFFPSEVEELLVAEHVAHRIKVNLGVTVDLDVAVVAPGEVDRSTGKARRVIDER